MPKIKTEKTIKKLLCIQSAGHYAGKFFPKIVEFKGNHWTIKEEWPGYKLIHACASDYAQK